MTTAVDAPSFHRDVVEALAELSEIQADETADTGTYRYKYASLAGIMRAIRPTLAAHRLVVTQMVAAQDDYLTLSTALLHVSGSQWESGYLRARMPGSAQQVGSMVSYLRRYQLVALLGLAVEDDDARAAQNAQAPPRAVSRSGGLGDSQRRHIMALFGDLGLNGPDNRDARLALTSEIVGRPLASTNEVKPAEASLLIDELVRRVADQEEG